MTDATIWLASIAAGFILFKMLRRRPLSGQPASSDYETELNEILNNDKYKVKGRFE